MDMSFFQRKLEKIIQKNNSLVCVGLDIDTKKMPSFLFHLNNNPYSEFTKAIINTTSDVVCAYKLNLAFYEALGAEGWNILKQTIQHIPKEVIIILDGKRNDIGNTAEKYASALFDGLGADATTVNPYLGWDGIQPFLKYSHTCSFVLCRTSNPSAVDFQDMCIEGKPLYMHVAEHVLQWNKHGCCGVVVGATYPEELKNIREVLGDSIPFLIPGVGSQGGDVEKTVEYGTNAKGTMAIVNSSRGIIYAGNDENFAEDARDAACFLRDEINRYRPK